MIVAVLVMPGQHFRQGGLERLGLPALFRQGGRIFHQIEQSAGIAARRGRQHFPGGILQRDVQGFRAAPRELHELRPPQRTQAQHMQAGKELTRHAEGGIFRGAGQQGQLAGFQQRQEKILLGFGKAVQLVQHQHLHAGQRAPQMLQARFRRADAQVAPAAGPCQQKGQCVRAAAGRPVI